MKKINFLLILLIFTQSKLFAQIPQIEDKLIKIQSVDIDTKIIGNTAVTKVVYEFYNPTNRDLEAKLIFPLPDGTTVSQYAIDINGKMRNAVPIPKERGKEVFESIQHKQVDPGLIEKVSGNNFRTRISPVPAGGSRTMQVTFLQELKPKEDGSVEYYLALNQQTYPQFNLIVTCLDSENPPQFIENLDGSLAFENTNKQWTAVLHKDNYTPNTALRIQLPTIASAKTNSFFQSTTANQFYFINSIQVPMEAKKMDLPSKVAIVWDNSFSAASRNFRKEWDVIQQYLALLPRNSTVDLFYLNNEFKKASSFNTSTGSIAELKKTLENTIYDGGTDFSKLKDISQVQAVLLFTDGIASFGDLNPNLTNKYYCTTSVPKGDFSMLRFLSERNGGQFLNLNGLNTTAAVELLTKNPIQFLGIKGERNVREIYPSKGIVLNNQITLSGILTTNQGSYTALFGYDGNITKQIEVQVQEQPSLIIPGFNVAQIWAQKKIAELEINYFDNKKEIRDLSNQFAVVSRNTSLIVLENIDDYVRFEITPPDELLAEYNNLLAQKKREFATSKKTILNKIAQKTQELKVWHATDFANTVVNDSKYPTAKLQSMSASQNQVREEGYEGEEESDGEYDDGEEGGRDRNSKKGKIVLSEISSTAAYMKEFNKLQSAEDIYALYLKRREQYKYSSKFYFDVSKLLYPKDKALALKVLSTLADLDLENEELYKTLHYVLKERGEYDKDLWITQKILEWRPFDAQSHRDYALSLIDNNKPQEALNVYRALIYQDFTDELSTRDNGIEEILVMEINNIISLQPKVNKDKVNKAFIADLPVDIRVVLNWNKDQTDIDLWVTDPNKEDCFYAHRNTKSGGRLSNDFVDGFGPEQFLLKKAAKGTYEIKTNFFAERQLNTDEPTAVMAEVYLYYSSGKQERKVIVFQYDNSNANPTNESDGKTMVGKFVF